MISSPVAFFIYKRPALAKTVFETIRQARPKILFLVADGPRDRSEFASCQEIRSLVENVDWDCQVYKNYSETNLGCRKRFVTAVEWIFSIVEEVMVLEEDTLPSPSFFTFCDELLKRYASDPSILHIGASNFVYPKIKMKESYYFSKYPHLWGWASWRRAWKYFDDAMKGWPEHSTSGMMSEACPNIHERQYWTSRFNEVFHDQIDTWDYQWTYCCWLHKGISISPAVNLVSNIGYAADAHHTKDINSPFSNMRVYDLDAIKHPSKVVINRRADKITFEDVFFRNRRPSLLSRIKNKLSSVKKAMKMS